MEYPIYEETSFASKIAKLKTTLTLKRDGTFQMEDENNTYTGTCYQIKEAKKEETLYDEYMRLQSMVNPESEARVVDVQAGCSREDALLVYALGN